MREISEQPSIEGIITPAHIKPGVFKKLIERRMSSSRRGGDIRETSPEIEIRFSGAVVPGVDFFFLPRGEDNPIVRPPPFPFHPFARDRLFGFADADFVRGELRFERPDI